MQKDGVEAPGCSETDGGLIVEHIIRREPSWTRLPSRTQRIGGELRSTHFSMEVIAEREKMSEGLLYFSKELTRYPTLSSFGRSYFSPTLDALQSPHKRTTRQARLNGRVFIRG